MPVKVRYSKKLAKTICDHVEDGKSIAEICRQFTGMPHEKSVWRWRRDNDDFKTMLDRAYQTRFWVQMDRVEELLNSPLPKPHEIADEIGTDDKTMIKAYLSAHQKQRRDIFDKHRLDLVKLAPKLIPEFSDKVTVQHQGEVGTSIIVQSYALPAVEKGILIEGDKK